MLPIIVQSTDHNIAINEKTHQLSTTQEYLVKEYSDVFQVIGALPGGNYHIKLKKNYNSVHHPLYHIAVSLKPACKAELDRLQKLGIITEVKEDNEWINSIVPVKKSDYSLKLSLNLKDLNKAIQWNQWYSRKIDDILPELANCKYFSLLDT